MGILTQTMLKSHTCQRNSLLASRRKAKGNKMTKAIYKQALSIAFDLMDMGHEPKSALKQAAEMKQIPYGEEMGRFVDWALKQF
jgi:hypothetical protein